MELLNTDLKFYQDSESDSKLDDEANLVEYLEENFPMDGEKMDFRNVDVEQIGIQPIQQPLPKIPKKWSKLQKYLKSFKFTSFTSLFHYLTRKQYFDEFYVKQKQVYNFNIIF